MHSSPQGRRARADAARRTWIKEYGSTTIGPLRRSLHARRRAFGPRLNWRATAEEDLTEAYLYTGADSPGAAGRLLDAVGDAVALSLANSHADSPWALARPEPMASGRGRRWIPEPPDLPQGRRRGRRGHPIPARSTRLATLLRGGPPARPRRAAGEVHRCLPTPRRIGPRGSRPTRDDAAGSGARGRVTRATTSPRSGNQRETRGEPRRLPKRTVMQAAGRRTADARPGQVGSYGSSAPASRSRRRTGVAAWWPGRGASRAPRAEVTRRGRGGRRRGCGSVRRRGRAR